MLIYPKQNCFKNKHKSFLKPLYIVFTFLRKPMVLKHDKVVIQPVSDEN